MAGPRLISIIGRKNAGKTTLTVALAAPSEGGVAQLLKEKGYADAKRELVAKQRDLEQNRNVVANRVQMARASTMDARGEISAPIVIVAVSPAVAPQVPSVVVGVSSPVIRYWDGVARIVPPVFSATNVQ